MKKFTLFLMSLFCILATSVAQDKEENTEPVEFGLMSVTPNSESPVSSVERIQMEFTKDVAVTLPEGGIEIKNAETNEVALKITSLFENEFMPKNIVILQFEQVSQIDKDGKEVLVDQSITTPGTYSYTIPAGMITSLDGEEFAEQTFTFTIAATFGYIGYTPYQTGKLETITITFGQEITEVKMPDNAIQVLDYYWTPVTTIKNEVTISEDKKAVTLELENPITTPDYYIVNLPMGVFISKDSLNMSTSLYFEVVDLTPQYITSLNDGDRVQELGNLEITFKNVTEVKLAEGEDALQVTAYLPSGGDVEGTATLADNKITVTFEEQFTEQGDYLFTIPEGMFTMDGVANEYRELNVELFTFTIVPLEVVSVTPETGTEIDQISQITIKFNQYVNLYYDNEGYTPSQNIKLSCGDQEYELTCVGSSFLSDELTYISATWDGYDYQMNPITTEGTYTLELKDIIVNHAADNIVETEYYSYADVWHEQGKFCEGTYTWTVTGGSAVEKIETVEGEQVIYDLLGRRVEKITGAGIYIVNGKKVVVK